MLQRYTDGPSLIIEKNERRMSKERERKRECACAEKKDRQKEIEIYMYIYIERERKRDRERARDKMKRIVWITKHKMVATQTKDRWIYKQKNIP